MNSEIFKEYLRLIELSKEEVEIELPKFDEKIHQIYIRLVELWKEFRESRMNWIPLPMQNCSIHMITGTIHQNFNCALLPCYLGDIEKNGKLLHVFMDSQSGQVFFMLSLKLFKSFQSLFMAGEKDMLYRCTENKIDYFCQLMTKFFEKLGFSMEQQKLYKKRSLSYAHKFNYVSRKPCLSQCQTDREAHEETQKQSWKQLEMKLIRFFLSMKSN